MRQPLKPFSVETRQNGRRKSGAPAPAARDMFAGMSSEGQRGQTYDAALRAADMLFSGAVAKQTAETPLASGPDLPTAEIQLLMPAPRSQGRILQAIEEPVAAPPTLVAQPAARRGRPPGSKNKVARLHSATPVKIDGSLRAEMNADALVASLFGTTEIAEPVFVERPAPIIISSGDMRLRFAWIGKTLGPGERWKRRLPRICW